MLPGYRNLRQISETSNSIIYQGIREADDLSVIIKLIQQEYPHPATINHYQQEYEIIKFLDASDIIKAYDLVRYKNRLAIVLEDFSAQALSYLLKNQALQLKTILEIARKITSALQGIHAANIIHKDINPSNILFNQSTSELKIIDFGIATQLPKEQKSIQNYKNLEGTLAYISPEQTGRMNRSLDYRSDYYSLGVTLYQLLSGQLPFEHQEPRSLIHAHMVKIPQSPHQIKPEIPEAVSEIVMKLMAKNAEDRYQSTTGIKHDLELCLHQLNNHGEIKKFKLGQKDIGDRFIIPDKLYGRETEVKVLLNSFERVAQGNSEMILVAGFSGIGKTAVVNEVYKPITKQRGYFIKGKYDQFNRNIPFSAFVQAFSGLVKQLLAETDEQLSQWKSEVLAALGNNAQVIISVIPNLEIILGKQPAVAELSGSAAQNRFNLVFGQFVQVFTKQEHPLVIFLDDLQWADSASLNLLPLLMEKSETNANSLLLLGAYRDNEVFPAHPLTLCLQEIEQEKARINTITLEPLAESDINCLVADTLFCSEAISTTLSELIYQNTQGNPFFTTQFLKGLYEDKYINFNVEENCWQCDLTKLKQVALTDDVVEFMVERLQKLPVATQEVLKLAACIGNRFNLETLAIICKKSEIEVNNDLWSALQAGLIIPETQIYRIYTEDWFQDTSENSLIEYRFLHDRVQQAVYLLIDESEKQITHFRIGQLLLEHLTTEQLEDKLFEVINQLNFSSSLIADSKEKERLARLNLDAGKRAKVSTAYNAASEYLDVARYLLAPDGWENLYPLMLEIYQESVETAYLNTDFQESEQLAIEALQHTSLLLDKVKIYVIQIQSRIVQLNFNEAITLALRVLRQLDEEYQFPAQPTQVDIIGALETSQSLLSDLSIAELLNLPTMVEPKCLAAMQVLASVAPPCYIAFPAMMPLIAMRMVTLSLTYGNAPSSAFGYAMYGFLLCGVANDISQGYQFGQLSLSLIEQSNAQAIKAKVLTLVSHFINLWHEPIHQCIKISPKAYQSGLESGDLEFAGYAASFYCYNSLFLSKSLDSLKQDIENYREAVVQYKQGHVASQVDIALQTLLNLVEPSSTSHQLIGEIYDERIMLTKQQQSSDRTGLAMAYVSKLMLGYIFEKYENLDEVAKKAEEYLDGVVAMLCVAIFYFYDSLISLRLCDQVNETTKSELLVRVRNNQIKVQHWANHAPTNYLHKFYLVEAEYERVMGNKTIALENYEQAISGAKENQFIQEEALANELAAKFYLDWGKEKVAAGYMQEAYYCYAQWGAKAKTNHLEQHYPQLLRPILLKQNQVFNPLLTLSSVSNLGTLNSNSIPTSFTLNDSFDLTDILRAAQVLTETLELEPLLNELSQIMLQNSGSDRLIVALVDSINTWEIKVCADTEKTEVFKQSSEINVEHPAKLFNYVKNTQEILLVDNLETDLPIIDDYLSKENPQSLLALPLKFQEKIIGIVYLHSSSIVNLYHPEKTIVLEFLCSQAAIALHNSQLFTQEQEKVKRFKPSHQKLESIIEQAPLAIIEWSKDFKFQTWNPTAENIFGYSAEEILGEHFDRIVPPKYKNYVDEVANSILDQDCISHTVNENITKNNQRITCEWSNAPLKDLEGNVYGGISLVWDVSDRIAAEQELQALSRKLELAIESAQIGIWEWNTQTNQLVWNDHMFAIYGIDSQDFRVTYDDWVNCVHPEDLAQAQEEYLHSLNNNYNHYTQEFRVLWKDGTIRYVYATGIVQRDEQGQIIRSVGMNLDITDLKEAEAALKLSEARAKASFEQAAVGIAEINMQSHKFTRLNNHFCEMLGYTQPELLELSVQDITHPDDLAASKVLIKKLLSKEVNNFTIEKRYLRQDGSVFWSTTTVSLMDIPGEKAKRLLVIIKDISDRKKAEKALKRMNEELEIRVSERTADLEKTNKKLEKAKEKADAANKAKSSFLANMSHELRTPLNGILGYAHILREDANFLTTKQNKGINIIYKSGNHLLTLINDILDHAKIEAGKLELLPSDIHLHNFLQDIVDMMALQAQAKNLNFQYLAESSLTMVIHADEKRLRQSLLNLLSNAVKFTDQGSIIFKVKTKSTTLPTTLENQKNSQIYKTISFSVQDSGIGISQDKLAQIFNPFEQVGDKHKQSDGTGLGLNITKQLIEKMGGNLQVTSEPGVGSTFWFEIAFPYSENFDIRQKVAQPRTKINTEVANNQSLIAPPAAEIEILYELAMLGSMKKIKERAGYLEELDEQYAPLAQKLRDFAEDFEEKAIVELIETYLLT